jgi:hypothetical protein
MRIAPWGVVLLVLLGTTSIFLAVGSSLAWKRADAREADAVQIIARTDSLMKDWVKRGCAPRTQALPD